VSSAEERRAQTVDVAPGVEVGVERLFRRKVVGGPTMTLSFSVPVSESFGLQTERA